MKDTFFRLYKRMHIGVITTVCIVITTAAHAQVLNLYSAVNQTLLHYPLMQQRQAEINAASAHIATVKGNHLPSFRLHDQVSVGTANSDIGTYFPLGMIPSTSGAVRAENNASLASGNTALSYLEWEVYNFGYYKADRKEAEASQALKQSVFNNDKYTLTQQVVSLYLELLKDYESLSIEEKNVSRTESIFTAISANVSSGLKPGVDSTTARAEYSKARIRYLQALNKYNDTRIILANYTGLENAMIQPDTALFSKMLSVSSTQLFWSDSIITTHPLLDVYSKQYELQLQDNKVISKKYLPKMYMLGVASMRGSSISSTDVYANDLSTGLAYNRYNYVVGAAITYNLFDLKHRKDQLAEGRYNAEAQKQALNNSKNNLNQMLLQTKSAYENTLQQLNEIPVQVQASRQAYHQQEALYKAGLNTLVDVTNALYALNESESNYVLAQDTFLRLMCIRAGINDQLDSFLQNFK